MSIRKITLVEFEDSNSERQPNLLGLVSEELWFADDESNLIGTVLFDKFIKIGAIL